MTDPRHLPPVEDRLERPQRLSQTLLSHHDRCPRSAYLYLKHNGGPQSHPMAFGSAAHVVMERMLWELIDRGEPNLYARIETEDPVHAKRQVASFTQTFVDEVLRERPDLVVPLVQVDDLRELAYHWAVGNEIDPARVVAVERKFVLDVGDYTLSGIIDVAEQDGDTVTITDYKSSLFVPSQDDFEAQFQGPVYAVLAMFGQPVVKASTEDGVQEVRMLPLRGVNRVQVRQAFPRYLRDDRLLAREFPQPLTRTRLHELRGDIERLVDRFDGALESGLWPAVPGSHCSICPARPECPLSEALRDFQADVTAETAPAHAERWYFLSMQASRLKRALKEIAKDGGPVPIGSDLVLDFKLEEQTVTDWDGYFEARAMGGPVSIEQFRRKRVSTKFDKRKVSKEERAA